MSTFSPSLANCYRELVQTQPLKIGDLIEVTTERLAFGGDAVARHGGLTVFIPSAAPGERLLVRIIERKKNFARAVIESIIEPSPLRRTPPCQYFGECGGCQLQHLTYEAQLEAKAGFIRDALTRIGKIDWPHEIPLLHAAELGYRTRAQIKLEPGRPQAGQPIRIGFYRSSSSAVCDVVSCPVLVPELDAALGTLREAASRSTKTAPASLFRLREVDMAAGLTGVTAMPAVAGLPSKTIQNKVNYITYALSASVFFQGNAPLLEALVAEALDDYAGQLAIDLYAGVGLFTLQLVERFRRVIGVESDREATQFAHENIAANQITNIEFQQSRVDLWLADFAQHQTDKSGSVDLLMLDPPRAGAADAIDGILGLKPARIVYVSCDPTTLARDLRRLLDGGYALTRVTGVDLFPQTYHVETVAHLTRSRDAANG